METFSINAAPGSPRPKHSEARKVAASLFSAGFAAEHVASALGVSSRTARRWAVIFSRDGEQKFLQTRRGRPKQISIKQRDAVRAALLSGPESQGGSRGRWTIKGASRAIEALCGVEYSHTQVWRMLHELGLEPRHAHNPGSRRDTWRAKQEGHSAEQGTT